MASPPPALLRATKKGIPLQTIWSNREFTAPQEVALCASLGVGWAYNYKISWDTTADGVQFIPMVFKHSDATAPNLAVAAAYNSIILGFNEPYNPPPQASMSQSQAATDWSLFTATGKKLGSPSTAGGNNWLPASGVVGGSFVSVLGAATWDYTCLHFYSSNFTQPGVVQALLDTAIDASYAQYGKKIIISEFGLIGFTADPATWTYPSMAQWVAQLNFSTPLVFSNDKVLLFSPYPLTIDAAARIVNANAANLTLANLDSSLTLAGQAYAAIPCYP